MPKLSVSQRKQLAAAAERYASQVTVAVPYLAARGITTEVAAMHRLGAVHEPQPADEEYAGRLAIPYVTAAGVVDIRYRALTAEQTPKYLSRPNAVARLFNVTALLTAGSTVVVCEGELDTIIMHSVVGVPAVGVPGANSWKPHFRLLLEDFERVIVMCDGDQAGRDFGKKIAGELDNASIVHLPEGMDVTDCYLQYGPEFLTGRIAA